MHGLLDAILAGLFQVEGQYRAYSTKLQGAQQPWPLLKQDAGFHCCPAQPAAWGLAVVLTRLLAPAAVLLAPAAVLTCFLVPWGSVGQACSPRLERPSAPSTPSDQQPQQPLPDAAFAMMQQASRDSELLQQPRVLVLTQRDMSRPWDADAACEADPGA